MFRYAITIFLSAFLLFQVQPLIGKFILPWFGGSPAVWTSCMLFFQVLLLGGYAYAHFVTSRLTPGKLAVVHLALLAVSLVFLPIAPSDFWKPTGSELPVGLIMGLLGATIGLPYFLLSSTGPLLQENFRRETDRTPYRLYSLSNIGSLLALLSYPFVFEPRLKLQTQIHAWSIGYGVFVLICGWSVWRFSRATLLAPRADADWGDQPVERPKLSTILLWLALAACGSVMLLATTNQMCQEVTSVPFLWVLPLSLYLLTFIICFDHEWWYHRAAFLVLLAVAVLGACYAIYKGSGLEMWKQVSIYAGVLWVCCMVCHGELVRARPAPQFATLFYLLVSAGGALGGILVAVVAPLVLTGYWEYPIGLVATVLLAMVATSDSSTVVLPRIAWIAGGAVAIAVGLALGVVFVQQREIFHMPNTLETTRNFYGVLRVHEEPKDEYLAADGEMVDNGPMRELWNGRIQHGFQYIDPNKQDLPTTYYGPGSGIGMAIERHPARLQPLDGPPMRIGVVGLGCGTLATYGRKGDVIRFYEINPDVIRLSDEYFSFLRDSAAKVEVVLGDARIKLEQEKPQEFDVLAIDAFSSDAIPMHLLTKEAVELFIKHLKPDGLLCIHISNRFLDLSGVVLGIAQELNYPCVMISTNGDSAEGVYPSTWAIITRNFDFLNDPEIILESEACWPDNGKPIVWTDDYGSVWQVLTELEW